MSKYPCKTCLLTNSCSNKYDCPVLSKPNESDILINICPDCQSILIQCQQIIENPCPSVCFKCEHCNTIFFKNDFNLSFDRLFTNLAVFCWDNVTHSED